METRVQKAFEKLKSLLGNDVVVKYDHMSGHFQINTEIDPMTELHLGYYENYGGSDELNEILEESGLYFEWENGAIAGVYDEL